jgi:serine/threonine-protein kinase RsbW
MRRWKKLLPATNETRTLAARPEALEEVHEMLQRFWHATAAHRGHAVAPTERHGFATAVSEVAANIIRYSQAASFDLSLTLDERRIEAKFIDAGIPFRGSADGELDPDLLAEGGMGLALAKRALHAFGYRRLPDDTNCWTLVLLLPATP